MHRFFPIIGLLVAVSSQAHHLDHEQALRLSRQGEILPVQQLLDSAIASHPDARLLDMKLRHKHGRYLYKLQLLDRSGQVYKLYFDAQSGELVKQKIYED